MKALCKKSYAGLFLNLVPQKVLKFFRFVKVLCKFVVDQTFRGSGGPGFFTVLVSSCTVSFMQSYKIWASKRFGPVKPYCDKQTV